MLVTQHDSNTEERIISAGQRSHFNMTRSKNPPREVEGFKQETKPQATVFPLTSTWISHLLLFYLRELEIIFRDSIISLTDTCKSCSSFRR